MFNTQTANPARPGSPAGNVATASQMPERFIRLPEVITRTGLSRSSIYAAIQRGAFPASVSLGGKSVAWLESEITAWQGARIATRTH
ncbi:helix-turn-helix transcriptional regulator [Chitinimonas sp. JJ19]|uniref:helix-turn-helix transcriptional regulator n=1 Tax=Chitinimonas sp. JJ19 TaxID=3109352 RepID=UPI0030032235